MLNVDTSRLDSWPDAVALGAAAVALNGTSQQLISSVQNCSSSWQGIADVYRTPETPRLLAVFTTVTNKAERIRFNVNTVSAAVTRYCETVRLLSGQRTKLKESAGNLHQRVVQNGFIDVSAQGRAQQYVNDVDSLQREVNALAAVHEEAQALCARAIRLLERSDYTIPVFSDGGELTDVPLFRTTAAHRTLEAGDGDPQRYLLLLAALTPTQLAEYGAASKDFLRRRLANPPPALEVKKWWAGLTTQQRSGLAAAAPGLIGNLEGVPYASRSSANRANLDAAVSDPRASQAQQDVLQKICAALESRKGSNDGSIAPRDLVSFDPDVNGKPLAAISIGNLDTAGNVTWNIPGMGTTIDNGLESWTRSSQDLYDEQLFALKKLGLGERTVSVVSWVGYSTPDNPPSADVISTAKAIEGGDRLAPALDGFADTRGDADHSKLNVVAHSYGTTTTAYALLNTDHKVDTVTFFGSAGINRQDVPDARALHVAVDAEDRPQVFVTAAGEDRVAPFGYIGSVARGRESRMNPSDGWFGGTIFSSEGGYDPDSGKAYNRTDGHDAKGWAAPAALGDRFLAASVGHGYLDPGTESAHNIALISTGNGDGLRPLIPLKREEKIGYGGMSYPTGDLLENDQVVEKLRK